MSSARLLRRTGGTAIAGLAAWLLWCVPGALGVDTREAGALMMAGVSCLAISGWLWKA